MKILIAPETYPYKQRFHVSPGTTDVFNLYRTDCGRAFNADGRIEFYHWPQPNNPMVARRLDVVICDKCWVEQDPADQETLKAAGCIPAHEKFGRPLKWKNRHDRKNPH